MNTQPIDNQIILSIIAKKYLICNTTKKRQKILQFIIPTNIIWFTEQPELWTKQKKFYLPSVMKNLLLSFWEVV